MNRITIKCPQCGEVLTVEYPSYGNHILTEEALETLAVDRAIQNHICKRKEV